MVAEGARRMDEAQNKKLLGVEHWARDVNWNQALERLVSKPTVNIEGLVGGYTGPGGKTILPHRAVAKMDLRLVPDMTAKDSLEALKKHLAKHGSQALAQQALQESAGDEIDPKVERYIQHAESMAELYPEKK